MPGFETHEIRDPIHNFISFSDDERCVINSSPFQRLRNIHQLGTTYLVYPGATHKRFEHSLGVMELAARVFDTIVENLDAIVLDMVPESTNQEKRLYWRKVLRTAALCHDIGHLPFSHTSEQLLPDGVDHETLTEEICFCTEMTSLFNNLTPPVRPEDVAKIALGPDKYDGSMSSWETLLSEIITGDSFGVDRMDYLLRDSHHLGVAYGNFDHFRLIDTIRILPQDEEGVEQPTLGIEEGGLHCAEAMQLARFFMFSQVYFHRVRCIYDFHLQQFMRCYLSDGQYPEDPHRILRHDDNGVLTAMSEALDCQTDPGHESARRIISRGHFRLVYSPTPKHKQSLLPGQQVYKALQDDFKHDLLHHETTDEKDAEGATVPDFPVVKSDRSIISAAAASDMLKNISDASYDYVFADPLIVDEVQEWLDENRDILLAEEEGEC